MPEIAAETAQKLRKTPSRAHALRCARQGARVAAVLVAPVLSGCSEAATGSEVDAGGVPGWSSTAAPCAPPPGVTGRPRTIEEATALLNALPKPTSVACFVESLERPLYAFASSSMVSAQPSFSPRSPRLFFKNEQLILSVVIEGKSSELIEFSYLMEQDTRSLKGELHLPLETTIGLSAPYDRVRQAEGTICRVCHADERREPSITFAEAFSSLAYRPNPAYRIELDKLRREYETCDAASEPERCAMLMAVFGGGPLYDTTFPDGMHLFF
jgi:hypothetical protein